jgi:hypothetical protein
MGLDKANVWADFIDWQYLQKMTEVWRPLETKIRDICIRIRSFKEDSEEILRLRDSLADTVKALEIAVLPLNTQLICGLTDSLKKFCACQ